MFSIQRYHFKALVRTTLDLSCHAAQQQHAGALKSVRMRFVRMKEVIMSGQLCHFKSKMAQLATHSILAYRWH